MKASVLANASAEDRNSTDFYPTPPEATWALMGWLDLPATVRVWEPAAGEGHMALAIGDCGVAVTATTLHDQGFGETGVDFLEQGTPRGDWLITNPPFKLAAAFIEHAMTLGVPFAMLLKSQFWHASGRLDLFNQRRPRAVLPLTWRPDFHFGSKGGSPTMECAWTVWDATPAAATVYTPLAKPIAPPVGFFA